ncbi:uncharacterized protein BDW43DRAFT_310787 [Aspergillus alliaceus]|uniref:uncharacterized protein n=1 Tax=Petromyces alliaceus TaxID=209559 RepID=UPI0012A65058|nr:uncharacterized protein BDW43DRAFT_310787 [Aspergillus alliaceus]KAB8233778.1 hypothetical protein BDW43DRAFT_310787 [Aspergillus alliaceus]
MGLSHAHVVDNNIATIVQIESPLAPENADAIATVPGVKNINARGWQPPSCHALPPTATLKIQNIGCNRSIGERVTAALEAVGGGAL